MSTQLHIVQFDLDRRALARTAARHNQPAFDEGYALHAGLAELFATSDAQAKVPLTNFVALPTSEGERPDGSVLRVLGYGPHAEAELWAKLGTERGVLVHMSAKEVPELALGTRATFRLRACPTVRTKQAGDRPLPTNARGRARGREVDAFIHATIGRPKSEYISRETVYLEWLRRQFIDGGASVDDARLVEFRRQRTYRERQDRRDPPERPDALLEGTLTVTDPVAFRTLLARGVGRHRSFGFGMLLLRPAR